MPLTFYKIAENTGKPIPFFSSRVRAGFPSPAEHLIEDQLDLNELIIKHPAATFFVQVEGNSMEQARIFDKDILVIDRSEKPSHKRIVIALLNGEFTVKRIYKKNNKLFLLPENPSYSPIEISENMDFEVWGVVTHIIHKCIS